MVPELLYLSKDVENKINKYFNSVFPRTFNGKMAPRVPFAWKGEPTFWSCRKSLYSIPITQFTRDFPFIPQSS